MSFIQVDGLSKYYDEGATTVTALSDIGVLIAEGEFVAIMGESGAGKSTLLSVLGAMNAPTRGTLLVDEIDVYALSSEQRADFRREYLGFVFQSFRLVPYLTVRENVLLPLAVVKATSNDKQAMADKALSAVGLLEKARRLPGQISGGEKERAAIARAIVNAPPILLADEPTGNLDSRTSRDIMELLATLNREGMTIVMVTHSAVCADYARRIIRLADGHLVKQEPAPTIGASVSLTSLAN